MEKFELVFANSATMNAVGETTALVIDYDQGDFGCIYCTYTDRWQNAVLGRKSLEENSLWEFSHIASGVLNDAHNGSSLGVDPQGHIHVVWDIHNSPSLNYKRSKYPGSIYNLVTETVGGMQTNSVSYARFYRAGNEFYLLVRVGFSGSGSEWIKRWTPSGWVDLAIPLISGQSTPVDNPYMGSCIGTSDGCLHIVWTHRVGYFNYGVYYARFDPDTGLWYRVDGNNTYTIPILRSAIEPHSITDPLDGTISNNGLGLVIDQSGQPNIVFSKYVEDSPEVFYAKWAGDRWQVRQISNLQLPRLRACPGGPMDGPPRPCDYQLQGPFITSKNGHLCILYLRSVGQAGSAWQRPPAILYMSTSTSTSQDGHWITREVKRDKYDLVGNLVGEPIRESNGNCLFLLQQTYQYGGLGVGNLWLWTPDFPEITSPIADISAYLPCGGIDYIELDGSDLWSPQSWTISAWVVPEDTKSTMCIIDKGGLAGNREFRLLLWGNAPPFVYDKGRVQVLIGGDSAWGSLWHPEVEVLPGLITHLALVWDAPAFKLRVYKNGEFSAETFTSLSTTIKHSDSSRVLIGANRDSLGVPEVSRCFKGKLRVGFYGQALGQGQIEAIYRAGM